MKRVGKWLNTIPKGFKLNFIKEGLKRVHQTGYVFVKIDRNPSRVMLLYRHTWELLQIRAFFGDRYEFTSLLPSPLDIEWKQNVLKSFSSKLVNVGFRLWPLVVPKQCNRPFGHFTVKQKCMIHSAPLCIENVKLRPLIAHRKHPLRAALRRVWRALSLIVENSIPFVQRIRPCHTPMWRLNSGTSCDG